jgi:hypothetical protein
VKRKYDRMVVELSNLYASVGSDGSMIDDDVIVCVHLNLSNNRKLPALLKQRVTA